MSDIATPAPAKAAARRKGLVGFALVVALVLAGIWGYFKVFAEGYESTDDAQLQGTQAVVASQTLGQIRTLGVDLGSRVSQGQVVATLDDRTQQSQRSQSLATIDQAQANLAQAQIGLASSAQTIELQRVKLKQAQSDVERAKSQFQAAVLSQEQYEHSKSTLEAEQAAYNLAVGQQSMALAQRRAAEAQLAGAQSALQIVDTTMTHVVLVAPLGGVVARQWVSVGDIVQPAQPVYTVVDLDHLWVDAYFKETQIRALKVGDPVAIVVDAYPGLKLTGKIERSGVTTAAQFALIPQDNTSGNFTKLTQRVPVRIALDAQAPGLVPGLSVVVTVTTKER